MWEFPMYVMVLAALLAWDDMAPKFISPHRSLDDCTIAADKSTKEHEDLLKTEGMQALGARFVCLKLVAPV